MPSFKWLGTAGGWATTLALASLTFPAATTAREEFYSELKACPVTCASTTDPSQWTLYSSLNRLTFCGEPLVFEVSLSGDPVKRTELTRVRACTAGEPAEKIDTILPDPVDDDVSSGQNRLARRSVSCPAATSNSTTVELASWGERSSASQDLAVVALEELQKWVQAKEGCRSHSTVVFGYFNSTVLGYFGGERVDNAATAPSLIKKLATDISERGAPKKLLVQHCASHNETSITGGVVAGVVVGTDNGFVAVQKAVRDWHDGRCVEGADSTEPLKDTPLKFFPSVEFPEPPRSFSFETLEERQGPAECRWIRVEQHDGCDTLARRCGITPFEYDQLNDQPGHCGNLRVGQPVCCTGGRLPELRPRQNPDGSCFAFTVPPDWYCDRIGAEYGLTEQEIYDLNKDTWGWSGCHPLGLGITICLSTGKPPMPAPVDNAVCGPTKPGSRPPLFGQTMADVSPCPLKVCCNIWGQCGTTADFCIKTESVTGAPGTAAPGTHGCVQACGMEIINNEEKPAVVRKLGYFEGWNLGRNCLHMDIAAVDNHREQYTDIHFSFAHVSPGPDYDVVIPPDVKDQWDKFVAMDASFRKILAFGGWAFSTEPDTYHIFREATAPANRMKFAVNCVSFAIANNLDGIDFDWEYPGAPDIPGIPPGGTMEGSNYLAFLSNVRNLLPQSMSLSIAAPASFWYLKAFPINAMAPFLDYIVYMTYDLHGQWDAGNRWANPGCETGDCLRSHVNWTETDNALAMITKAGVNANKVLMGVATYGRSFKMARLGCWGPDCRFLGDRMNSPAKPGRCTGTGGYLANAEIFEIIDDGARTFRDEEARSDITVYENTEWVAWMSMDEREWREAKALELNFGGTIEWAVDLQDFLENDGIATPRSPDLWKAPQFCDPIDSPHDTLEELLEDDSLLPHCLLDYAQDVILKRSLDAQATFKRIKDDDWDKTFDFYKDVVIRGGPPRLESWILSNGARFFDCRIEWTRRCCSVCAQLGECRDCIPQSHASGACSSNHEADLLAAGISASEPTTCPTGARRTGDIRFNVKPDMSNALYSAIEEDEGFTREQIRWGTKVYAATEEQDSTRDCTAGTRGCRSSHYRNYPMLDGVQWRRDNVPSPVDVIETALGGTDNLTSTIAATNLGIRLGIVTEDPADMLEAFYLPVLLLEEAVEAMEEAHEIGKQAMEEYDKTLALLIAQLVFFVVPFLGKALSAVFFGGPLATLIRFAANVVGDLGLIGVDAYKIHDADTPEDKALLAVGIVITGLGTMTNYPSMRYAAVRHAGEVPPTTFNKFLRKDGEIKVKPMREIKGKRPDVCPLEDIPDHMPPGSG